MLSEIKITGKVGKSKYVTFWSLSDRCGSAPRCKLCSGNYNLHRSQIAERASLQRAVYFRNSRCGSATGDSDHRCTSRPCCQFPKEKPSSAQSRRGLVFPVAGCYAVAVASSCSSLPSMYSSGEGQVQMSVLSP